MENAYPVCCIGGACLVRGDVSMSIGERMGLFTLIVLGRGDIWMEAILSPSDYGYGLDGGMDGESGEG